MSIVVFRGGKYHPQSGGRLITNKLGRPNIFLPNSQVGYGFGGVLRPLGRKVLTALKGQVRKIPKYLGRVVKRHGKNAAKQLIAGVLSGKIKKGQRKKAVKRIAVSNLQKAKQDIQKAVIKSISPPKQKKQPRKRKAFYLPYRNKPTKKRRKDICDK